MSWWGSFEVKYAFRLTALGLLALLQNWWWVGCLWFVDGCGSGLFKKRFHGLSDSRM